VKQNGRKLTLYIASFALIVALMECAAFLSIKYVLLLQEPSLFFREPSVTQADFSQYLQSRDPLLGWPASKKRDPSSGITPRNTPSFSMAGSECVSTYGDSFTYGDEVTDSEAWSNVLSVLLGCRVANYGVGGYGTDQAYLRYARNTSDKAKVVILGIFPDNVMRNVNQYRYFLDARTTFSLKPRFVSDGDRLKLVEIPKWGFEEFVHAINYPAKDFSHEAFLPDSDNGPVRPSFPYIWRAIKLLLSERVRSGLLGNTSWEVFYRRGHPTQALEVTTGIVDLFSRTSFSRAQCPVVIIYPTGRSFAEFKKTGRIATAPLFVELGQRGITFLDLHKPFRERGVADNFCNLLTNQAKCVGHFNAEGNKIVAEILRDYLTKNGVIAPVVD
jgi:hypothetical protein